MTIDLHRKIRSNDFFSLLCRFFHAQMSEQSTEMSCIGICIPMFLILGLSTYLLLCCLFNSICEINT